MPAPFTFSYRRKNKSAFVCTTFHLATPPSRLCCFTWPVMTCLLCPALTTCTLVLAGGWTNSVQRSLPRKRRILEITAKVQRSCRNTKQQHTSEMPQAQVSIWIDMHLFWMCMQTYRSELQSLKGLFLVRLVVSTSLVWRVKEKCHDTFWHLD